MTRESRLSDSELDCLNTLYHDDGAWTPDEARGRLARLDLALDLGVLTRVQTLIGPLYLLSPDGRDAVFGSRHDAQSLTRQQDRAYLRLCLEHYGWTFASAADPVANDLKGLAGQRLLHPVHTPEGLALVGAQMTSGGFRPLAIKNLGDRLRSSANHRNFRVILFTPKPDLGQDMAQHYAAFMTLIPLVPTGVTTIRHGVPTRVQIVPKDATPGTVEAGPYATRPVLVSIMAAGNLPACTADILALPRAERIARFRADLRMDKVIAETQLQRHYGLMHDDLPGVAFVEAVLRPRKNSSTLEVQTRLYLATTGLANKNDSALMHLVGVGEMRRMLGVTDPAQWVVSTAARHRVENPDAVWQRGWQTVAIEYDSGHYGETLVLRKLDSFKSRGMHETIWGVPSSQRAKRLMRETAGRLTSPPLVTRWWQDSVLPPW